MAKTFSEWIAELSAVAGLGAGDKVPVVEGGVTKYVEGDDLGGGITALTGDVTASGTGSVVATIAAGAVTNAKVATGIDAAKIGDGTISNTEFQYLNGVSSAIQTQLDAKAASGHAHSISDVTSLQTTLDGKQTLDATLTAFAGLTIAADSLTIGTGSDAFSQTTFAANTFPAKSSAGNLVAKTITDFGLSLLDDADASTARTTLGLGSVENTALSTWAGSTNVTTLGTIGTGTWNATQIGVTKGGTGLTSLGSALQQLRVNAGGTALEYFTPSASSGDITNGGNTTGAAVTIGTNDAFGLNLETAGVTRMAITGGASTGGAVTITNVTANTATVQDVLTIQANSTGTAAASFGGGILFQGESSTTDNRDMARISSIWTTATDASRSAALIFSAENGGTGIAECMRIRGSNGDIQVGNATKVTIGFSAMTTATAYTIGNSSSALNLGASSGALNLYTVGSFVNDATIGGNQAHTFASLGKVHISISGNSYTASSGSGTLTGILLTNTYNLTGTASGVQKGIDISPTLTSIVGGYRAIDIQANHASAKGIYQSGASTTNNFVGGTMFGSTSAPSSVAAIEISSTTKGFLLPRMTATQRDAITAVAGLMVYNTDTNKLNFYNGAAWEAVTSA